MKKRILLMSFVLLIIIVSVYVIAISAYIKPARFIFNREVSPEITVITDNIILKNQNNFNILVNLEAAGDISDFTEFNDNNFELLPTQSKEVEFILSIPPGEGDYYGSIVATYEKVDDGDQTGQSVSLGCDIILFDDLENCGNSKCDPYETYETCPEDCQAPEPEEYCGDDICNNGEICSTCSQDCGECQDDSGSSGDNTGGGSSGGGGGGGSSSSSSTTSTNTNTNTQSNQETINLGNENEKKEEVNVTSEDAAITGGVIGAIKRNKGKVILFSSLIILVFISLNIYKYKKKNLK